MCRCLSKFRGKRAGESPRRELILVVVAGDRATPELEHLLDVFVEVSSEKATMPS